MNASGQPLPAGRPARRRFRVALALAAGAAAAAAAAGHDPMRSWATLQATGEGLVIEVEMQGEAAMSLLGVPAGTAPIPQDANVLLQPLAAAITAGKLYRIRGDGGPVNPIDGAVEYDGTDAFRFRLRFPPPEGPSVMLEAAFLAGLPEEHRTLLLVLRPDGATAAQHRLTRGKPVIEVDLPARDPPP